VRNLMEQYQHDFSEFDGTDLDEHGQLAKDPAFAWTLVQTVASEAPRSLSAGASGTSPGSSGI